MHHNVFHIKCQKGVRDRINFSATCMDTPTIAALIVLTIYFIYYIIVISANKKYREYVTKNNVVTIISNFVVFLVLALLVVFGLFCSGTGASINPSCGAYSWILALCAIGGASVFVASTVYTQVKVHKMPAGAHNGCPVIGVFHATAS